MESINITISAIEYLILDTRIRYVQNMTAIPINVTFADVTIPTGSIARIYIRKPSDKEVFNDCTLSGNTVTINPTAQTFAESGLHHATIQITHLGKLLISKPILFDVLPDYSSTGAIESSNEFTALLNALDRVENATGGSGGSGTGTGRYIDLTGKPKINNVELVGNKSLADLGAQPAGDYVTRGEIPQSQTVPTKVSQLANDSGYQTAADVTKAISGKADSTTVNAALSNKVDRIAGKGLSTNDFTNELKQKLLNAGDSSFNGQYASLYGKPQINNVELSGNKTLVELGIQPKGDYAAKSDLNGKVDKNQGTNNQGKVLGIGADGMVTPVSAQSGTPGTPGKDGKTPVKGVDYWTTADKQEMVNDVLASLQTWNGGRY